MEPFQVPVDITSDLHLPEMRQLFKDACCFQHGEFIVVQAPSNREMTDEGQRERARSRSSEDDPDDGRRHSQFCCVLRDVVGDSGEFLVGAVDRRALTATLLGAGQVGEAVPAQLAPVILRTWLQSHKTSPNVVSSRESKASVHRRRVQQTGWSESSGDTRKDFRDAADGLLLFRWG